MSEVGKSTDVLTHVDFGRYDAESDPNVLDYFVVTGTAREAASGAQLVVGRKGSGKTALRRHLAATLDGQGHVIDLDLEEYVFQVHRGLIEAGVASKFAYTSSWRLLILVALYAAARPELDRGKRKRGDEALSIIGMSENKGPFAAILGWLKRVRRLDLPSVEGIAAVGGIELADAPQSAALVTETTRALATLEEIVGNASRNKPGTVLIDRLDDAWDGSPESLDLITGAVRATRQLAVAFNQKGAAPVVTFLRTDLWEKLSFNDRNKMSQDMIHLDWTPAELAGIIERRISRTAGLPEANSWEKVFTTAEMRQRASSRTYILKRTIGRPRDIVAFASLAKREAVQNAHDRIESEDIYSAELRYSKHALDELRDEIEGHVADFTRVINSLKALRQRTFTVAAWMETCAANGLNNDEATTALEQLFEASAVGVHRTGGATGGSRATFRYQDRYLRWTDDASLQVHLAFVRELGLKDS
ncbi:P-loop ATPase, Sll1717 family [Cellulosimicrobium funkei]|uniref:P-loop ATPase, Sll1717 family n=1 Tax=Cellulosimicrobium funkei TaxID=264251 RepID=UPI0036FB8AA4